MRVSTSQLYRNLTDNMMQQSQTINELQNQISSGKRVVTPADDPIAIPQINFLKNQLSSLSAFKTSMSLSNQALQQQDTIINSVQATLNNVKSIILQAQNATLNYDDRQSLAKVIEQNLLSLRDLANSQDANGQYIFSGFRGDTQTFTSDSTGRYSYNGDQGIHYTKISQSSQIPISLSGYDLFVDIPATGGGLQTSANQDNVGTGLISNGFVSDPATWAAASLKNYVIEFNNVSPGANYSVYTEDDLGTPLTGYANVTYTAGEDITVEGVTFTISGSPQPNDVFTLRPTVKQDIFTTLSNLADTLNTVSDSAGNADILEYNLNAVSGNIDAALDHFVDIRSTLGANLNALTQQQDINTDATTWINSTLANLENLDMPSAISLLTQRTTGLQAAQMVFSKIQSLSLLNFLN